MLHRLIELATLFLKLGTISFGGPAVHLAMMEQEVVRRRGWLSPQRFLDLVGVTHLIPGPNATEMASHVGYRRAGLLGSLVAGLSFTLPAALIAVACGWAYDRYGQLPQVEPVLGGIKAAVLAVIFAAVFRLGKDALRLWPQWVVGAGVAAASLAGADEVLALLVGSLVGMAMLGRRPSGNSGIDQGDRGQSDSSGWVGVLPAVPLAATAAGGAGVAASLAPPLWKLGLFFLKVGAVWYGSGYVLIAYLDSDFLRQHGLSDQQLLDAVAVGQVTPGPLLSTVTFVGYLFGGAPGALVATTAILLPSFFFVALVNPWVDRLRESPRASRFLDAVNAAAVGLMAAVTCKLSVAVLIDRAGAPAIRWPSVLIAMASATALFRWRVAPAWLVLAGGVAGAILGWV